MCNKTSNQGTDQSSRKSVELMAPAGDFESLQAAIDNGADSIYFGVDQLNMRARSTINFTLDDLSEISKRCMNKGVRSYLTLNTIIYDHDLSLVRILLEKAKEHQISTVIAADQAVIAMARSLELEVHISTQVNITNIESVRFYSLFADTVVLSRELSLRQIKSITDQIAKDRITGPSGRLIEIEVFAHGALCMAVSGKCYLSLHSHNSSANRGACKQNCRRKYVVKDQDTGFEIEIDNEYMMSPKDLCTIGFLDQVLDAGVKVLKIEGRGRAPEYVATVTKIYNKAINAYFQNTYSQANVGVWLESLSTVYNRGFWDGYYLGQKLGEWTNTSGSVATTKKIYLGKAKHYYAKASVGHFFIESFDLKVGDKVLITGPTTGVKELKVDSLFVEGCEKNIAAKGENITIKLPFRIRNSDKLYKIVTS